MFSGNFRILWHRAAPFLLMLCLFTIGAALSPAQTTTVPAVTPPGTIAADAATAIGWIRWVFGILAVALLIFALVSVAKHPGAGIMEAIAAVVCIILAANAQGIVSALYHTGQG